jgi:hypothetical protein
MSYEEEDTCHMRRRIHLFKVAERERLTDRCHMRRRIHVI